MLISPTRRISEQTEDAIVSSSLTSDRNCGAGLGIRQIKIISIGTIFKYVKARNSNDVASMRSTILTGSPFFEIRANPNQKDTT